MALNWHILYHCYSCQLQSSVTFDTLKRQQTCYWLMQVDTSSHWVDTGLLCTGAQKVVGGGIDTDKLCFNVQALLAILHKLKHKSSDVGTLKKYLSSVHVYNLNQVESYKDQPEILVFRLTLSSMFWIGWSTDWTLFRKDHDLQNIRGGSLHTAWGGHHNTGTPMYYWLAFKKKPFKLTSSSLSLRILPLHCTEWTAEKKVASVFQSIVNHGTVHYSCM